MARDYSSVYTITDITWNRSPSLTLNVKHDATPNLQISANGYFRYLRADTINPNLNGNSFDESLYNLGASDIAALNAAGYKGFPTTGNATTMPFPFWRCLGQALSFSEALEKCDALVGRSYNFQHNFGATGQVSWKAGRNHLIVGTSLDHSSLTYRQTQQFGYLNADRISITLVPAFADGSTNSNNVPVDNRVNLHGTTHTPSVFLMDTLSVNKWTFTFSGRFNHTNLNNQDRIPGSIKAQPGASGGRASLNGNYSFDRFNPSIGFTYSARETVGLYFNYSEANRTPTTIELGCADPNYPCNLPNALVSDPPLKQVVTKTFESGARGTYGRDLKWSAGWFFAQNYDDLLFVSSAQTGFGYFLNFGKTRRDGFELSLSRTVHSNKLRTLTMGGNYTFQNGTFQSPQTVTGGANSFSDGGKGFQRGRGERLYTCIAGGRSFREPRVDQVQRHALYLAGVHEVGPDFGFHQ